MLCLWSGAALLNIVTWEDRYPDVLVLGGRAPRHERINGHRTSYLPREHVTMVRGIAVTTAERTLLDLAGALPERRLRRAVRQAQFLKLTTVRSLVAVLHGPGPASSTPPSMSRCPWTAGASFPTCAGHGNA